MKAVISRGRVLACAIAWALCALLGGPGFAFAAPSGSISLVCTHERDGASVPLAGDTYAVVAVASAVVENGGVAYTTLPAFGEIACDWSSLDAAGVREQSRAAHEVFARGGIEPAAVVVTSGTGRGVVDGLAAGIYLVARIEAAPSNAGVLVDPALVGIPTDVDGVLDYDVMVHPKFEDAPGSGEDPQPDKPGGLIPGFDLPTTGDVQLALVGLLLLLGTATLWSARRVAEDSPKTRA